MKALTVHYTGLETAVLAENEQFMSSKFDTMLQIGILSTIYTTYTEEAGDKDEHDRLLEIFLFICIPIIQRQPTIQ